MSQFRLSYLHKQPLFYFPNSFSIIFLIALISVKVNLIPQLYIANTSFKFSTNSLSSFLCIIIGFSCDKIPHQLPDGEHLRTILFLSHLYSKWLHLQTELFISRAISKRQTFTSSTASHPPGYGYPPSEDGASLRPLPHALRKVTYHRNQCPSSLLAEGS